EIVHRRVGVAPAPELVHRALQDLIGIELPRPSHDRNLSERSFKNSYREQEQSAARDSTRRHGSTRSRAEASYFGSSCLHRRATSLSVRARERRVDVTPGPRFGAAGLLDRYLRLPFTLPSDQLRGAVEVLALRIGRTDCCSETVEQAYVV